MKKLMIAVLMACSFGVSAADVPTDEYRVEISGPNDIIVEFTPKGAPHMLCVVYDMGGKPTMQCFPKK